MVFKARRRPLGARHRRGDRGRGRSDQRRHRLRAHQLPGAQPRGRPAARPWRWSPTWCCARRLDAGDLAKEKRRDRPGDRRGGRHARRPGVRAGPGARPSPASRSAGRCSGPRPASARREPPALAALRAALYAPDRIVVGAAGAVDEDELLALAERLFARAPRPSRRADAAAGCASSAASRREARRAGAGAPGHSAARRRRRAIRTTSPCACSPRCSAAACRRGCSRRCASGWASPTPSTPIADSVRRRRRARRLRRRAASDAGQGGRGRRRESARWPGRSSAAELARAKAQLKAGAVHGARIARRPRRTGRRPAAGVRPAARARRDRRGDRRGRRLPTSPASASALLAAGLQRLRRARPEAARCAAAEAFHAGLFAPAEAKLGFTAAIRR